MHCAFDDKDKATKSLAANDTGWISQERGAKYYKQNFIIICDVGGVGRWHLTSTPPGLHTTWPFVMPSRGLCRQNGHARMLDFDPTQLWSMWTHTDMSAKLYRNEFMSDHCSGIAMWTRPKTDVWVRRKIRVLDKNGLLEQLKERTLAKYGHWKRSEGLVMAVTEGVLERKCLPGSGEQRG